GAYLEEIGESDPLVLAEHHHLGGALPRAMVFYVRAAEQLFEHHDLSEALRCVQAGIACGASGAMLGDLRAIQVSSAFWMEDYIQACESGWPILSELIAGSYRWCKLMVALLIGSTVLGRQEDVRELSRLLLGANPEPDARRAYIEAAAFQVNNLSFL